MLNPEFAKEIEKMVAEKTAKTGHLLLKTTVDGKMTTIDISDYQIQIIYRPGNRFPYLAVARNGATEYKLAARTTEGDILGCLAEIALKYNTGIPIGSCNIE